MSNRDLSAAQGLGLEPSGRIAAVKHENGRLREALALIAEQGDRRNGEFTRADRKREEPESWAARIAYFTLYPERRGG